MAAAIVRSHQNPHDNTAGIFQKKRDNITKGVQVLVPAEGSVECSCMCASLNLLSCLNYREPQRRRFVLRGTSTIDMLDWKA